MGSEHSIPTYEGDPCISTNTALGIGCKGKVKIRKDGEPVLWCPKCSTEYGRIITA